MARIALEIVTPDGIKLSESVDELTAPSVEGEFGVLPGHIPLLAALKTGIVSYRVGGDVTRVAVGPGFVEVVDDKALVLTDLFITKPELDPVRAFPGMTLLSMSAVAFVYTCGASSPSGP